MSRIQPRFDLEAENMTQEECYNVILQYEQHFGEFYPPQLKFANDYMYRLAVRNTECEYAKILSTDITVKARPHKLLINKWEPERPSPFSSPSKVSGIVTRRMQNKGKAATVPPTTTASKSNPVATTTTISNDQIAQVHTRSKRKPVSTTTATATTSAQPITTVAPVTAVAQTIATTTTTTGIKTKQTTAKTTTLTTMAPTSTTNTVVTPIVSAILPTTTATSAATTTTTTKTTATSTATASAVAPVSSTASKTKKQPQVKVSLKLDNPPPKLSKKQILKAVMETSSSDSDDVSNYIKGSKPPKGAIAVKKIPPKKK